MKKRKPKRAKTATGGTEKSLTLDELLSGITPENLHPVTDCGPPVGKEIW